MQNEGTHWNWKLRSENSPTRKEVGLFLKHLLWLPNGEGIYSEGVQGQAHELSQGTLDVSKRRQCLMVVFWYSFYTLGGKEANRKGTMCLPQRHWDCEAILWSNGNGSYLLSTPNAQHFTYIISFHVDNISLRNALSFFHDKETESHGNWAGTWTQGIWFHNLRA